MRAPTLLLTACALLFPSAACADEPWFVDVAEERGLPAGFAHRNVWSDLDGDGWADAVLHNERVFLNRPDPAGGRRFVEASGAMGALGLTPGGRRPDLLLFGDLDGDGDTDAFVGISCDPGNPKWTDDGARSRVFLQEDGRFVPLAGSELPPEPLIAGALLDVDRDGLLDVVTGGSYVSGGLELEATPLRLWRGLGQGRLTDATEEAGLSLRREAGHLDSRRPIYGITAADWNGDGQQDLLVCGYGRQRNLLFENRGGRFVDVGVETGFAGDADQSGAYPEATKVWWRKRFNQERHDEPPFRANGNTFAAAPGDVNNDGHLDVFLAEITHAWAGPSSDRSSLLVNQGPPGFAFRRAVLEGRHHADPLNWNQGDLYAAWFDADNDGLLDLLLASGDYPDDQRLRLFHQAQPGVLRDASGPAGLGPWDNATQISLADYDRDGDLDVLVGNSNMRLPPEMRARRPLKVALFENRIGQRNHWLNVRLIGGENANRDALGARVTVVAGDLRLTRELSGGVGHAGQNDARELAFGLGANARVERLEVRWPDADGSVSVFTDLPADRCVVIRQGATAVEVPGPH